MNWNYIFLGLTFITIGLAVVLAPWPLSGWPDMPKAYIQAIFAAGVLSLIVGLVLVGATIIPPLLRDKGLWPQTGMVVTAVVFIFCFVFWYFEPAALDEQDVPHIALSLIIDSLNDNEPNFHVEAKNDEGPQVTILKYYYKTPKFSDGVVLSEKMRPILPRGGKISIPGKLFSGITQAPTSLDVTLTYQISKAPQKVFKSIYRFFVDRAVTPPARFEPVNWQESEGKLDDRNDSEQDIRDGLLRPSGTVYLAYSEKKPDGSPNQFEIKSQNRRIIIDPTAGRAIFVSKFPPSTEVKSIEILFALNDQMHFVLVTWDETKQTILLRIDGTEESK